jgi:hypothetical protein
MSDPRPGAFDPEGDGYDYRTAKAAGIKEGPDGHWPSREPKSGRLLKGRKHKTFEKGVKADKALGYDLEKRADGRYYTIKKKKPGTGNHPLNK